MAERCVVCGQPLPAGLTPAQMHRRLDKLGATAAREAAAQVKRDLETRFKETLSQKAAELRKSALREARASSRAQVVALERQLASSKAASQRELDRAVGAALASSQRQLGMLQRQLRASQESAARSARKAAREAATRAVRVSKQELAVQRERGAKERAQHASETARLKRTVDELSTRLERQTSEQLGEMTEADALAALKRTFPHDDIQRIDRGTRGADILQKVIENGAEAGRIVYECKNATSWQNEWITKARGYRTQYATQWVVIASKCFPRREKWFVVERGFPVIELRLIVRLAEVIRAAVVEIAALRLTTMGRQEKSAQMLEYVLSDHFASRFRSIGEAVTALRSQQDRERQWHNELWAKERHLYDEVDANRGELWAQVRAIAEAPVKPNLRVLGRER